MTQLQIAEMGDQVLVAAQRLHSGLCAAVDRINAHNAAAALAVSTTGNLPAGSGPPADSGPMADALSHSASIITQMAAHIASNSIATPPAKPAAKS